MNTKRCLRGLALSLCLSAGFAVPVAAAPSGLPAGGRSLCWAYIESAEQLQEGVGHILLGIAGETTYGMEAQKELSEAGVDSGMPYSYTSFTLLADFKGGLKAGTEVTIRQYCNYPDSNVHTSVGDDAISFYPGAAYLVFANEGQGYYAPHTPLQGGYQIIDDEPVPIAQAHPLEDEALLRQIRKELEQGPGYVQPERQTVVCGPEKEWTPGNAIEVVVGEPVIISEVPFTMEEEIGTLPRKAPYNPMRRIQKLEAGN